MPELSADTVVGCTFIMWRGRYTGNVVTCGVCDWCRSHFNDEGELIDGSGAAL